MFTVVSLPAWGRGLKLSKVEKMPDLTLSLPAWGRGLKPYTYQQSVTSVKSLPAWGRGLKPGTGTVMAAAWLVAPRVGAWIETTRIAPFSRFLMSLPAWGRGLKRFLSRYHWDR